MSYRRPPILQHTPFDFDASELLDEFVERCQRLLFFFKARRPSRLPLPLFLIGPGRRRCATRRGPRCVLRCRHRTWPGQGGRVARLPHQPSRVRVVRHIRIVIIMCCILGTARYRQRCHARGARACVARKRARETQNTIPHRHHPSPTRASACARRQAHTKSSRQSVSALGSAWALVGIKRCGGRG